MSHKRFPPGPGHVLVPVSSTREALAGLSLYTPSRRRGLILRSTAEWMVRALGPASLPGRRVEMTPIPDAEVWDQIEELLRRELGPFDALAVHTRRKPHRPGAAVLLLSDGNPIAFVKVGSDSSIEHEHQVLTLLERSGKPMAFEVPEPLGIYAVGETRVAVMTVLSCGQHRPITRPPLAAIVDEVQRALRHLPRPKDLPLHWVPMHGDLSPWNLRMGSAGRVVLFDWEESGFGPPGADEVYYAVTSSALGFRRCAVAGPVTEAVGFWQALLEEREPNRLRKAMLRRLRQLGRG